MISPLRSNTIDAIDTTNTTNATSTTDDDDGCLAFIEDFCKPYVKPLFHQSLNLLIGAGIVALAQIHFAFLAIERYRAVTPIGRSDTAQQRPEHTEAEPGQLDSPPSIFKFVRISFLDSYEYRLSGEVML